MRAVKGHRSNGVNSLQNTGPPTWVTVGVAVETRVNNSFVLYNQFSLFFHFDYLFLVKFRFSYFPEFCFSIVFTVWL